MKSFDNDKHFDESITRAIGAGKIKPDFEKFRQAHPQAVQTLISRAGHDAKSLFAPPPNIWSIIMQNKITKFAAAVVILGVILGTTFWGDSSDRPGVVLAEMLEIMKQKEWIHYTYDISNYLETGSSGQGEGWMSFNPMVSFLKEPDGSVTQINIKDNIIYLYDHQSGILNISYQSLEYHPLPNNPGEFIIKIIEDMKINHTETKHEIGELYGRQVEVFHARRAIGESILYRDIESNLLIRTEDKVFDEEGNLTGFAVGEWDYPRQGPNDIYELGVPKDVIIHDNRPTGDEQRLIETINRYFEAGYGDYIAVILRSSDESSPGIFTPANIQVIRHQGTLTRSGTYTARPPIPDRVFNTLYADIKDDWPYLSLEQLLALESDDVLMYEILFGAKEVITRSRNWGEKEFQITRQPERALIAQSNTYDNLPSRAWGNFYALTTGNRDVEYKMPAPDRQHENLVGIQVESNSEHYSDLTNETTDSRHSDILWFDPARDYLMIEHTSIVLGGPFLEKSTRQDIIMQTARTPGGKWYPSHIHHEAQSIDKTGKVNIRREDNRIILKTDPVFTEGVFDPDFKFKKK